MTHYTIHTGIVPDIKMAIDLYVAVGWGAHAEHDQGVFEKAFQNSHFITAYDNQNLLGFVRVLSDGHQTTFVIEFLVDPKHQKTGIGSALMSKLQEAYGHTSIYTDVVEESLPFFTRNGMKRHSLQPISRRAIA